MFHVNDLMTLQVKSTMAINHITLLDAMHCTKDPFAVAREKVHEYSEMTGNFVISRGVTITQYYVIKRPLFKYY